MKKLYTENGYLNFNYILKQSDKHNTPYIFIVGGRGTGKTYGALKYCMDEHIKIIFMRRTQSQHDIIRKNEFSPYKAINRDTGKNISFFPVTKYNSAIFNAIQDDKGKLVPDGESLGITCALSTISNMRGFDASDSGILIYDEFIPEKHERPLKNEASALLNAIETIARNRELKGDKPLKLLALANANNISNEIFISLGLVTRAEKMIKSGNEIHYDTNKGVMLIILSESPISHAKTYTSLYLLSKGTEFADMAIHNDFTGFCHDAVNSQNLMEYKLLYVIGEICIYKHKSKQKWYVCGHISGHPIETYTTSINALRKFRSLHRDLWVKYISGMFLFESYTYQVLFEKYFKIQ